MKAQNESHNAALKMSYFFENLPHYKLSHTAEACNVRAISRTHQTEALKCSVPLTNALCIKLHTTESTNKVIHQKNPYKRFQLPVLSSFNIHIAQ